MSCRRRLKAGVCLWVISDCVINRSQLVTQQKCVRWVAEGGILRARYSLPFCLFFFLVTRLKHFLYLVCLVMFDLLCPLMSRPLFSCTALSCSLLYCLILSSPAFFFLSHSLRSPPGFLYFVLSSLILTRPHVASCALPSSFFFSYSALHLSYRNSSPCDFYSVRVMVDLESYCYHVLPYLVFTSQECKPEHSFCWYENIIAPNTYLLTNNHSLFWSTLDLLLSVINSGDDGIVWVFYR